MEQIIKGAIKATDKAMLEMLKAFQQYYSVWPISIGKTTEMSDNLYFYVIGLDTSYLGEESLSIIQSIRVKYPNVDVGVSQYGEANKFSIELNAKTEEVEDIDSN